jgi:peptidoglycan hydrolase-like protein with peptidoglycan-binding domain
MPRPLFLPVLPLTAALWMVWPAMAQEAADRALLVGNARYAEGPGIEGAADLAAAVDPLTAAGFSVSAAADLDAAALRAALSQLLAEPATDRRLILALSGQFAQSARGTWFLGTDASAPDLVTVGAEGVPLSTVLEIAASQPGGAVVLLGTEPDRIPLGPGLEPGIGRVEVPQGITLIRGDAARIADFVARSLPARGQSLAALLDAAPDLTADGLIAPLVPFRPVEGGGTADPIPGADPEAIFWESTSLQGTQTAYQAYLQRYPNGRHAAEARAEINRILAQPAQAARVAESELNLSQDDRRAIQRALSLLGFDPKGIDGVFGTGSRRAIANWQGRNGYDDTAFLTRDQIVKLTEQADARAAELEREAQARKAEQERADRLYWQETGAAGDEAGLRAYLRRFPDGLYADTATARLGVLEDAARDQAGAADRAAWDLATRDNTAESYRDYLQAFPDGTFATEATARLDALQAASDQGDDLARWQAAEEALGLNAAARRLVELRLDQLEMRPGDLDGTFDAKTRRALRRFQESRGLVPTGYLDQTTTVALLAGGVLRPGG